MPRRLVAFLCAVCPPLLDCEPDLIRNAIDGLVSLTSSSGGDGSGDPLSQFASSESHVLSLALLAPKGEGSSRFTTSLLIPRLAGRFLLRIVLIK